MRGKRAAKVAGILGAGMLLWVGGWIWGVKTGAPPAIAWAAERPGGPAYTPAPGSPERRAIMDALRGLMEELTGLKLIFVVRHLKVKGNWAWLEVEPQSPDGQKRYEPLCALLKGDSGYWEVAELPSTEEDSPVWQPGFARSLQARFPGVPLEIFPPARR